MEPFREHLISHVIYFFSGVSGMGLLSHAVNTFPAPKSAIGRWALGVIQYAVGQRQKALETIGSSTSGS